MKIRATDAVEFSAKNGTLSVVSASPAKEIDPFRRLIFEWLDAGKADGLSSKTLHDYQDKAFKFWWWWTDYTRYSDKLGPHPRQVSRQQAREYAAYLREPLAVRWGVPAHREQLSSASIASYGRAVKVFFSWLETEGIIEQTPFGKGVKFSSKTRQDKTVKRVEDTDIARLFQYLTDPLQLKTYHGRRDLAIVALLFDSGIRRGELLSLRVDDMDMDHCRCKVRGKTGQRYAMFSEACREALDGYLITRREHNQEVIPEFWLTERGEPLGEYGYNILIQRLRKRSGVNFSGHRLRHTFASTLASQGVDPFMLRDLLGHSSITTTQIYVNQSTERMAVAYSGRSPLKNLPEVSRTLRKKRGRPNKKQIAAVE